MHAHQAPDEYSRLLQLFGLDDRASKDEIKRAYRQLAKDYHPDRMQDKSAEEQAAATERFDELKRAYDRILEFKQSQFGSFTGE
ncbi:MAG: DnaJ domain-containing protein [Bdellovibrionales bacterium]|nr:DnaJ domain-containing protein [Bdellovibrionales bacterium]